MRQMWTIMVIVSFLSVLSGSFIAMAHSDGSIHTYICLASRINGSEAPCPESDPIGFAGFHGSALRSFTNLTVVDGSAMLIALALLGIALLGLLSSRLEKELVGSVVVAFADSRAKSYTLQSNKLSWFSIHENSPSYFRAMN